MALEGFSTPNLLIVAVLVSIVPIAVAIVTPFLKISIILYILRNAFSTQQVPPTAVVNAVALIVSMFIMAPTIAEITATLQTEGFDGDGILAILDSTNRLAGPIVTFMTENTDITEHNFFMDLRATTWPQDTQDRFDQDSLFVVVPAFVLSELKSAFLTGFLLYLPFIVIDVVVSSILITVGMQTVNPNVITIPLKFLLFISVDGWTRLVGGTVSGYV